MKTKTTLILIVCLFATTNIFAQNQNFPGDVIVNGKLGVGTTSPQYTLDVNGPLSVPEIQLWGGKLALTYGDDFSYNGKSVGNFSINWIVDSWQPNGASLWLSGWGGVKCFTAGLPRMSIDFNGNVGIGSIRPGAKLDVAGTIRAHEIKVCLNQGCDYVFAEDYNLMNLKDLNSFIKTNKHLPEVAPAAQMEADGINVSEMNALLLKKVEELTLHIIKLNDRIEQLEK